MKYPESFVEIIEDEAIANIGDSERAVERAKARVLLLPEYQELIDTLITDAIRHCINDRRHSHNTALNRAAGSYSLPNKESDVSALNVAATSAASYFEFAIAGRTIGSLTGSEVVELRKVAAERADGWRKNEAVLAALEPLMKDKSKTVKQQVKAKQLEAIFQRVHAATHVVNTKIRQPRALPVHEVAMAGD